MLIENRIWKRNHRKRLRFRSGTGPGKVRGILSGSSPSPASTSLSKLKKKSLPSNSANNSRAAARSAKSPTSIRLWSSAESSCVCLHNQSTKRPIGRPCPGLEALGQMLLCFTHLRPWAGQCARKKPNVGLYLATETNDFFWRPDDK